MSQLDVDECWKKIAGTMEEEVLNKYKVEDSQRGVYRGRGEHLKRRRVRRSKKYRIPEWCEDCKGRIFSWSRESNLQRIQSMKVGSRMKDMTRKIRTK